MSRTTERLLRAMTLAGAVSFSTAALADVISLRADEWCPYNCVPGSKQPGIMLEVAKRVFEPAGHQVDYGILSWARAIEDTRQGKFVGIIGAARRDAPDFVFPGEELGMSRTAFVTRKSDSWEFKEIDSLKNRTLGVIRDYSYSERLDGWVEANKANEQRVQVTSGDNALELNLRKLQRGRIDTVMDGEWVLLYTLPALKLEKELRVAGIEDNADPVFIAFSPANPKSAEYARLLADGIARLRASGELAAILAKYGVSDWKRDLTQ